MPSSKTLPRSRLGATGSASGSANGSAQGPSAGGGAACGAADTSCACGAAPKSMVRASEWTPEVENAFRIQEAGYRDATDALARGHPPLEYWPTEPPLLKKMVTRETLGKEASSIIYFSKRRECEDKSLAQVKLYSYD